MADYPASLDTNPTILPTTRRDEAGKELDAVINDIYAQLEAIQAKLGIDSSAVNTSIDYLVKSSSSSNPGHKHTLADGATDVTATATELNILDGLTTSTAELNKLDGVTADTAEINILDGLTTSTAELNKLDGVTADTAEINILDGLTTSTAQLNLVPAFQSLLSGSVDWTNWTPTFTNLAEGNGTLNYARYVRLGDLVFAQISFTFGSTSSISGDVSFTLPAAPDTTTDLHQIGYCSLRDATPSNVYLGSIIESGGKAIIRCASTSSSYLSNLSLSSTVPFNWAAGDYIAGQVIYKV